MDVLKIQERIYYGYSKCAEKLGSPFTIYRTESPIDPITLANEAGIINASASVNWEYDKPNTYGNAVWRLLVDGRLGVDPHVQVGDFIVEFPGYSEVPKTYFIASKQLILPIQGVYCDELVSIVRPSQTDAIGDIGYVGYLKPTSEVIASNFPISVLSQSTAVDDVKLPTVVKQPVWKVLIPNLSELILRVGDIITDSLNQDFVILSNELTELGWRVSAQQVVDSR